MAHRLVGRVVISLADSNRRQAFIEGNGAGRFRVFDAFDSRSGEVHPVFDVGRFRERYGRRELPGEVGVAVSHYLVLKEFSEQPGGPEDVILVAEDDAMLVPEADGVIDRLLNVRRSWDYVLLGELSLPVRSRGRAMFASGPSSLGVRLSWLARPVGGSRPFAYRAGRFDGRAWGTGLYVMSRSAAQRYVRAVESDGLSWVADDYDLWGPLAGIDIEVLTPRLARFVGPSTIAADKNSADGSAASPAVATPLTTRLRDSAVVKVRELQATIADVRARYRRRP